MEEIKKEDLSLVSTEDLLRELKERWPKSFFFAALDNKIHFPYPEELFVTECARGFYDERLGMLHKLKIKMLFYLYKFHKLSYWGIK